MNLGNELYFLHPFVSNSALSGLLSPVRRVSLVEAYALGTLVDAMITTRELVDTLRLRVIGYDYQFTAEQFKLCRAMRDAFLANVRCRELLAICRGQQEFYVKDVAFEHNGLVFNLDCKAKFDLWSFLLGWGGEIKTTAAATMKQFINYCHDYDYDRQAAWYMHISGALKHVIIGISKVASHPIFIHVIEVGSPMHLSGQAKIQPLAYEMARLRAA